MDTDEGTRVDIRVYPRPSVVKFPPIKGPSQFANSDTVFSFRICRGLANSLRMDFA